MANTDNKCSSIEIDYEQKPSLHEMLMIQADLQEKIVPGFASKDNTLKEIADFFIKNKHAWSDEMGETIDAIGGINDGIGSAAWKWWKKDHNLGNNMTLSDLTHDDQLELKFEIVDQFHFFMNQMVKIGMSADELASMYVAKNKENIDRLKRGY